MMLIRILALLALLSVGGTLIAWLVTGDPRYRMAAWRVFLGSLLVLLGVMLLFVFERLTMPLG